jgi:hypothetical protein
MFGLLNFPLSGFLGVFLEGLERLEIGFNRLFYSHSSAQVWLEKP